MRCAHDITACGNRELLRSVLAATEREGDQRVLDTAPQPFIRRICCWCWQSGLGAHQIWRQGGVAMAASQQPTDHTKRWKDHTQQARPIRHFQAVNESPACLKESTILGQRCLMQGISFVHQGISFLHGCRCIPHPA